MAAIEGCELLNGLLNGGGIDVSDGSFIREPAEAAMNCASLRVIMFKLGEITTLARFHAGAETRKYALFLVLCVQSAAGVEELESGPKRCDGFLRAQGDCLGGPLQRAEPLFDAAVARRQKLFDLLRGRRGARKELFGRDHDLSVKPTALGRSDCGHRRRKGASIMLSAKRS